MMNVLNSPLAQEVFAAIAAGNGPEGEIFDDLDAARKAWHIEGGYLLKVTRFWDDVYLVTQSRRSLSVNASVTELRELDDDDYPRHPAASSVVYLDDGMPA